MYKQLARPTHFALCELCGDLHRSCYGAVNSINSQFERRLEIVLHLLLSGFFSSTFCATFNKAGTEQLRESL